VLRCRKWVCFRTGTTSRSLFGLIDPKPAKSTQRPVPARHRAPLISFETRELRQCVHDGSQLAIHGHRWNRIRALENPALEMVDGGLSAQRRQEGHKLAPNTSNLEGFLQNRVVHDASHS
jgi:hypothetical protein